MTITPSVHSHPNPKTVKTRCRTTLVYSKELEDTCARILLSWRAAPTLGATLRTRPDALRAAPPSPCSSMTTSTTQKSTNRLSFSSFQLLRVPSALPFTSSSSATLPTIISSSSQFAEGASEVHGSWVKESKKLSSKNLRSTPNDEIGGVEAASDLQRHSRARRCDGDLRKWRAAMRETEPRTLGLEIRGWLRTPGYMRWASYLDIC